MAPAHCSWCYPRLPLPPPERTRLLQPRKRRHRRRLSHEASPTRNQTNPYNRRPAEPHPSFLVFLLSRLYKGKFVTTQPCSPSLDYHSSGIDAKLPTRSLPRLRTIPLLSLPARIHLNRSTNRIGFPPVLTLTDRLTRRAKKTIYPHSPLPHSHPRCSSFHSPPTQRSYRRSKLLPSHDDLRIRSHTVDKNQHAPDAVCVADANYGWWLSGFAQRPTLSAVDPQYLILSHEFAPAKAATNLLATDYFIDNGLVRVTQNGPYLGNGPTFSSWLNNSYLPYQFFSLKDTEKSVLYRPNNIPQHEAFSQSPTTDLRVVNDLNYASLSHQQEKHNSSILQKKSLPTREPDSPKSP